MLDMIMDMVADVVDALQDGTDGLNEVVDAFYQFPSHEDAFLPLISETNKEVFQYVTEYGINVTIR